MINKNSLVSIIIPVKNSEKYLADCLSSINAQTYKYIEVLIVDSHSTDNTHAIANKYSAKVIQCNAKLKKGKFDAPYKRNFGVEKSKGDIVYYVDADMVLPPTLIQEVVSLITKRKYAALVVAEDSFGVGIWAKAKQLERRCYWGDDTIEAARVFTKEAWTALGGLDTSLGGGGDDWDLYHRALQEGYSVGRPKSIVLHNEGHLFLSQLIKKRFMYGRDSVKYLVKRPKASIVSYFPIRAAYIRNWKRFVFSPVIAVVFVIMRFCEYAAGFSGILYSRFEHET